MIFWLFLSFVAGFVVASLPAGTWAKVGDWLKSLKKPSAPK